MDRYKKYREAHRQQIYERNKQYRETHREKFRESGRRYRRRIKTEVLTHYGNGVCRCVFCGFSDLRALSIDHIEGGGNKHRASLGYDKERGWNSRQFYRWLQKEGYPPGYQTLCLNCQQLK